jgi:hypothetical protein
MIISKYYNELFFLRADNELLLEKKTSAVIIFLFDRNKVFQVFAYLMSTSIS